MDEEVVRHKVDSVDLIRSDPTGERSDGRTGNGPKQQQIWTSARAAVEKLYQQQGKPTRVPDEFDIEFLKTITVHSHPEIYELLPEAMGREIRRRAVRNPSTLRFCGGVNKHGEQCGGIASKRTGLCAYHTGLLMMIGDATKGNAGYRRSTEVIREIVEENLQQEVIQPVFDALNATKVAKIEGQLYETDIPDHTTRLKAHEMIMDRIDGKPDQSHRLSGSVGNRFGLEELFSNPTDPEIEDAEFEEVDE